MSPNDEIENSPFSEEFDKKDVVNKKEKDEERPSDAFLSDNERDNFGSEEINVEDLENYDEQEKLREKFELLPNVIPKETRASSFEIYGEIFENEPEKKISESDYAETEQEILRKKFKDFLVVREISGDFSGLEDKNFIPAEKIDEALKVIEIEDTPETVDFFEEETSEETKTTVAVHKNEEGTVDYIEVVCACGRKTIVELSYEEKGFAKVSARTEISESEFKEVKEETPEETETGEDESKAENDASDSKSIESDEQEKMDEPLENAETKTEESEKAENGESVAAENEPTKENSVAEEKDVSES